MIRIMFTGILLVAPFAATVNAQANWDGEFTITSKWNDLAVDVPEGKKEDGLAIIQWGCHGKDAQKWKVEAIDGAARMV